jgi:hypothetical protein
MVSAVYRQSLSALRADGGKSGLLANMVSYFAKASKDRPFKELSY